MYVESCFLSKATGKRDRQRLPLFMKKLCENILEVAYLMNSKAQVHFFYSDLIYHSDHSNQNPVLKSAILMNNHFFIVLIITLGCHQDGVISQNDEIRILKFRCHNCL